MAEINEEGARAPAGMNARLIGAATVVLAPLRSAALVALGGTVLAAEVAQRRLARAAGESERQLDLFAESVRHTTARWWPARRKGPHPTTSARSSRSTVAS